VIVLYQDKIILESPFLLVCLGGCLLLLRLAVVVVLSYLLNVAQVIVSDGLRIQVVVVQRIADLAL